MRPLAVWIGLCLVWGSTWIFIKFGLADLPPFSFAALRFSIACALLYPFLRFQGIVIPSVRDNWRFLAITGILQFFFNYGLLFWGGQFISSGLAAVLQATIPAFGLILARFYVGEAITALKIISILVGMTGVVLIFREQLDVNGEMAFFGSIAVVAGAFGASYASVLTKARGLAHHPAGLVLMQMLFGHLWLWVVAVLREGNPFTFAWTPKAAISVAYLAVVGSIIAFWLYYWLLSKIDVSRAMMIALVTPLIAVIIGAYFGERLEMHTLAGGALILVSVFLIVVRPLLKRGRG
jgi:drug/metabolite transporter (DMT)-like permease